MTLLHNKALIQRVYDDILNQGQFDLIDTLYDVPLRESLKCSLAAIRTAFPDVEWMVQDIIAEADKVVSCWSAQGTHLGAWRGIAPTHKQAQWDGMTISYLTNERITHEWVNWNRMDLYQQLVGAPAGFAE
jgi:predicted ester cyclase